MGVLSSSKFERVESTPRRARLRDQIYIPPTAFSTPTLVKQHPTLAPWRRLQREVQ